MFAMCRNYRVFAKIWFLTSCVSEATKRFLAAYNTGLEGKKRGGFGLPP